MSTNFEEARRTHVILDNIQAGGGGGMLSIEQVRLLQLHPAYTDSAHPNHAALSATVREYYQAVHPGPGEPQV